VKRPESLVAQGFLLLPHRESCSLAADDVSNHVGNAKNSHHEMLATNAHGCDLFE